MRTLLLFFLFQSTTSLAAPTPKQTLPDSVPNPVIQEETEPETSLEPTTGWTIDSNSGVEPEPQKPKAKWTSRYAAPTSALTIGLGLISEDDSSALYTFLYQLPSRNSKNWEFGADAIDNSEDDGEGAFHWGYRKTFGARELHRFFIKGSFAWQGRGFDGLAFFFEEDNFRLRGSVGMENILSYPLFSRVEIGPTVGLEEAGFFAFWGLSLHL